MIGNQFAFIMLEVLFVQIGFEEKMALEESLTRSNSADNKLRVRVKGSTKPAAS